jgi:hypothetical protein
MLKPFKQPLQSLTRPLLAGVEKTKTFGYKTI